VSTIASAVCGTHPAERAVETCSRCGSFICAQCIELDVGEVFCPACHSRQFGGKASGRAVTALVLAIVGMNLPFLGVPAIVLAHQELSTIARGEAPAKGRPLARGAQILGWIEVAVCVLVVIGVVVFWRGLR
jgi:hypothetical protein